MTTDEMQALTYLQYVEDGENLSDTTFDFRDDCLVIYQPIDDEENDKYIIMRNKISEELWDQLVLKFDWASLT